MPSLQKKKKKAFPSLYSLLLEFKWQRNPQDVLKFLKFFHYEFGPQDWLSWGNAKKLNNFQINHYLIVQFAFVPEHGLSILKCELYIMLHIIHCCIWAIFMQSRVVLLSQGLWWLQGTLVSVWKHLCLSQRKEWEDKNATVVSILQCTTHLHNEELSGLNAHSVGIEKA